MLTTEDLVALVEDITDSMTVSDLRTGDDYKSISQLSEASWAILVRFIGGERPPMAPQHRSVPPELVAGAFGPSVSIQKRLDELERQERAAAEARGSDGTLKLKGNFDGIELP